METLNALYNRYRQTGVLFLIGLLLIIYVAFGFVYWQQMSAQTKLEVQITQLNLIVGRPPTSSEQLQEQYEDVNHFLAPLTANKTVAMLVDIAERSGIDISPGAGKFKVPIVDFKETNMGSGAYQLLVLSNVNVQGDYEDVMAFISDLDSGKTLATMRLTKVNVSYTTEVEATGEDAARRAEFRNVASAVKMMMLDNGLLSIPNPLNYRGGIASNRMGDNPETIRWNEGFPDITTTAAEKGYTGYISPRDGYVLYEHDRISADDTTSFDTVSYTSVPTTKYYYTCETDGTVRQFDKQYIIEATEYFGSENSKVEVIAHGDITIYTKP